MRIARLAVPAAIAAAIAGCTSASHAHASPPVASSASPAATAYSKILVIPEENHSYSQIIGSGSAPYLNQLATTYGLATNYDAGYAVSCPSLPGYLLMTEGTTNNICDDNGPGSHPQSGDNVFHQAAATGRQWRGYAESMPSNCATSNSGNYAVRHAPAPYYTDEATDCASWDVPLGTTTAGAFQADLAAGTLPAYSFVTPNLCHDMHGGTGCSSNLVKAGDDWLGTWIPKILASPDYTAGRLVVVITFDEGSSSTNHIATVVVSPTTSHVSSGTAFTHCSLLRTSEEIIGQPLLGCAASATSMRAAFGL
jgi:phosphatidylinositol-3-phosphatase